MQISMDKETFLSFLDNGLELLNSLIEAAEQHNDQIQKHYKGRIDFRDQRIRVFNEITTTLHLIHHDLTIIKKHYFDYKFWGLENENQFDLPRIILTAGMKYDDARWLFTHKLFMVIEYKIRDFYEPCFDRPCPHNIKNVFDKLVDYTNIPTDKKILFEIISSIRNTIHTNGVYNGYSGVDFAVRYSGRDFRFIYGKEIDVRYSGFASLWEMNCYLYSELFSTIHLILLSNRIVELEKVGNDAYILGVDL